MICFLFFLDRNALAPRFGPSSSVHVVEDLETQRRCVLRVVPKLTAVDKKPRMYDWEFEVAIAKRIDSAYVLQLLEVYETPEDIYLISEFCEGGSLSEYLTSLEKCTIAISEAVHISVRLHPFPPLFFSLVFRSCGIFCLKLPADWLLFIPVDYSTVTFVPLPFISLQIIVLKSVSYLVFSFLLLIFVFFFFLFFIFVHSFLFSFRSFSL
jgi:hypothetical protein